MSLAVSDFPPEAPAPDPDAGGMETHPFVVLYDGVCGLCNRTVQFVLKRDRRRAFRFAPLQGEFAAALLGRHGRDPSELETMFLALDANGPNERLLSKARAILKILRELGGGWGVFAALAGVLPTGFLNGCYGFIARRRYRWFGRYASCPLPKPEERARFIGL